MQNIVLVWAWGTGMSWVAGMLWDLWFHNLVCIDATQSQLTDKLLEQGIQVIIWHGKYEVQSWDIVIYSAATIDSPEVKQAQSDAYNGKDLKIVRSYFEFLWEISKYFQTVWIIWTNGKSTTTALWLATLRDLLPKFGLWIVWALVPALDNKSYVISENNSSDIKTLFDAIFSKKEVDYTLLKKYVFMLEACEYKRHFLYLDLDYAVLTSLECDHLDYFKNKEDYISAFAEVITLTRNKVFVLDKDKEVLKQSISSRVFPSILSKLTEVVLENISFDYLFGVWNQRNASLLLQLFVQVFDLNKKEILEKFQWFRWLWRRMESLGRLPGGALLYSDYGHMASSLQLWTQALHEKYPNKKIVTVFQPHQLRRVVIERNDFVTTLKQSDENIVYHIYAARETIEDYCNFALFKNSPELSIDKAGELFAEQSGWIYIRDFDILWENLNHYGDDTVVVVYSAGDVDYLLRWKIIW